MSALCIRIFFEIYSNKTMVRVLLFGTHPNSSNGYSKVLFHLAKHLASKQDIQLTYYGFQNFQKNPVHDKERELPSNVQVYDAFANEKTKHMGFGFEEVTDFVTMNKPDLCIVYNDMVVVSNIIDKLKKVENRNFKIAVYVDQVYLCQKKEYINRLNEDADFIICFSKYWEECIKGQGLTKPTAILEHGFNPLMHYPVPKKLARTYFNLKQDDFIIMNANRNQPRKRLDIMMMAFAEFVSRHITEPVKLLIATAPTGAWNLLEIYERELKLRGITLEEGMKHLIFIDNPQALTDEDMNILFNASDVGINTAMGEGWGLCNFEAGAMCIPQIVPLTGGFRDFFDETCAILVKPKIQLYTDMTIDGCPGCAEICDAIDFADAFEVYYSDEDLRKRHGETSRKRILQNYKWSDLGEKLYKYVHTIMGTTPEPPKSDVVSLKEVTEKLNENNKKDDKPLDQNIDKTNNKNVDIGNISRRDAIKNRLQAKLAAKKNQSIKKKIEGENLDKEELLQLKAKIDKLLQ